MTRRPHLLRPMLLAGLLALGAACDSADRATTTTTIATVAAAATGSAGAAPVSTAQVTVTPSPTRAGSTAAKASSTAATRGSGPAGTSAGAHAPSSARTPAPSGPAPVRPSAGTSRSAPGAAATGAFVSAADLAAATTAVAAMSTAQKAGSVIMASSADAVGTDEVAQLGLGGVILMGEQGTVDGTTSGSPEQVLAVTRALQAQRHGAPILVGTDQEYGDVVRLVNGFTHFPGSSVLADDPLPVVTAVAQAAAQEMLAVGVTVDFAPDADILPTDGSSSAIGDRSYGSDPQTVAAYVDAAVRGYQSAGLAATLKHFPGIGRIAADTHVTLPTLAERCSQWNADESVPMAAGVRAGVGLVMTGHVLLPAAGVTDDPTSLSADAVTDLLKGNGRDGCRGLGFTGVTVTDSLQMAPVADRYGSGDAAVQALLAGQDLLLMPVRPDAAVAGIVAAVSAGRLPATRLDDAAARVYALRLATARAPHPDLSVIGSAAHQELAERAGG